MTLAEKITTAVWFGFFGSGIVVFCLEKWFLIK